METTLSEDRLYRYLLVRRWITGDNLVAFVGLNPSTADETEDDPTIRRCVRFAKDWGYAGLVMVNLFAWRATDPMDMRGVKDAIGTKNNEYLLLAQRECHKMVAAWGGNGDWLGRDKEVVSLLRNLDCLDWTKMGAPKHPLYIPADMSLKPYARGGTLCPRP